MKKSGLADSPFFTGSPSKAVLVDEDRSIERNTERSVFRSEYRSENRSENRSELFPVKRRTKRYSFEFYEDQLIRLKHLKYQAELEGMSVSLSDIARQALDDYLKNK